MKKAKGTKPTELMLSTPGSENKVYIQTPNGFLVRYLYGERLGAKIAEMKETTSGVRKLKFWKPVTLDSLEDIYELACDPNDFKTDSSLDDENCIHIGRDRTAVDWLNELAKLEDPRK